MTSDEVPAGFWECYRCGKLIQKNPDHDKKCAEQLERPLAPQLMRILVCPDCLKKHESTIASN